MLLGQFSRPRSQATLSSDYHKAVAKDESDKVSTENLVEEKQADGALGVASHSGDAVAHAARQARETCQANKARINKNGPSGTGYSPRRGRADN